MILVDSLYINNSGGLRLLEYLVDRLTKREVDFYLLADSRCLGKFNGCKHVRYMTASLRERKRFYEVKRGRFSSILCFGNIPAPLKMGVPVYTYFHNINLLTLSEAHSLSVRIVSWLKREVFKHYKKNTDYWLVQTENTADELTKHLQECPAKTLLMPFFELSDSLKDISTTYHGNDYAYIANYTGAKGHEDLLEAWKILHRKGIDITLHLTIGECFKDFIGKIEQAQAEGIRIINHGFVPFEEVIKIYHSSKALVYPSHNESLGLGIIEAISAGCDILGADLPYTHAICKPSLLFDPYSPESIADAVIEYEKGKTEKSELLVYNHIDELINLLAK